MVGLLGLAALSVVAASCGARVSPYLGASGGGTDVGAGSGQAAEALGATTTTVRCTSSTTTSSTTTTTKPGAKAAATTTTTKPKSTGSIPVDDDDHHRSVLDLAGVGLGIGVRSVVFGTRDDRVRRRGGGRRGGWGDQSPGLVGHRHVVGFQLLAVR